MPTSRKLRNIAAEGLTSRHIERELVARTVKTEATLVRRIRPYFNVVVRAKRGNTKDQ